MKVLTQGHHQCYHTQAQRTSSPDREEIRPFSIRCCLYVKPHGWSGEEVQRVAALVTFGSHTKTCHMWSLLHGSRFCLGCFLASVACEQVQIRLSAVFDSFGEHRFDTRGLFGLPVRAVRRGCRSSSGVAPLKDYRPRAKTQPRESVSPPGEHRHVPPM